MKRLITILLCFALLPAVTAQAAAAENVAGTSAALAAAMKSVTGTSAAPIAADKPDTSAAQAAIIYEATTGTVLYADNADGEIIPASMTKVMTAVLTIEHNPTLDGMLTVSQDVLDATYAVNADLSLMAGEKVGVREVLEFMLVCSANEAANTLAEYVAGSVEAFPDMMNAKLKEIGCENSHFLDAAGLSSYGHYTTAEDMVKLLMYAMQYPVFRECVGIKESVLPPSNTRTRGPVYETTNRVMFPKDMPGYINQHSEYMVGGKSGSLSGVGNSFAGLTERDGMEIYTVVAQAGDRVIDGEDYKECYLLTIDLLDYAVNFGVTSVSWSKEVARLPVNGGGTASVAAAGPNGFVHEAGETGKVMLDLPETLPADTKAGDVVGKATLEYDGQVKTVDLVVMGTGQATVSGETAKSPNTTDAPAVGNGSLAAAIGLGAIAVAASAAVFFTRKRGKAEA